MQTALKGQFEIRSIVMQVILFSILTKQEQLSLWTRVVIEKVGDWFRRLQRTSAEIVTKERSQKTSKQRQISNKHF